MILGLRRLLCVPDLPSSKASTAGCDVIVEDGLSQTGTRVTEVHELPMSLSGVEIRQFFEISVIGTGGPVEDIPTNLKSIFFPGCERREWATWDDHSIDVVIGMDNSDLFPMPLAWRDSLILSKSVLSNLLIVWGRKERVQHLDLGPLEVNELMPEAHLFNQSSADISIVFQELSEDVLPSAPLDVLPSAPVDVLPSAPVDVLPSAPMPDQTPEQQVKVKSLLPRYCPIRCIIFLRLES